MNKVSPMIALSTLIFLSLSGLPLTGQVVIAEKGRPVAEIVVAPDAGPTEKYAADELWFFLHFMIGAAVPVIESGSAQSAASPGTGRLLVGEVAVRLADPDFRSASLKPAEVIVRTQGSDIILAGGSPRGTLYAVYTFLEDVLGCRWWTSTAWRIPRRPTLTVPPVAIRLAPPPAHRHAFWFVAFDPFWAARNKANGLRAGGDDVRGGGHVSEGVVHTVYSIIPPASVVRHKYLDI